MSATVVAATLETSALWRRLASLRSRFGFRFSATGRTAAALVADGRGYMSAELWLLDDGEPRCVLLDNVRYHSQDVSSLGTPREAIPFDQGSLLITVARAGGHDIVYASGSEAPETVGRIEAEALLLAGRPDGAPGALLLAREEPGRCTAWSFDAASRSCGRVAELGELILRRGGWLDRTGRRFALNRAADGRTVGSCLDLADGPVTPLSDPRAAGDLAVLVTAPDTGRAVVAVGVAGRHQLAVLDIGAPPVLLAAAQDLAGVITPQDMDRAGRRLSLTVARGARSDCVVVDLDADRIIEDGVGPEDRSVAHTAWVPTGNGEDRLWCVAAGTGRPIAMFGRNAGPDGSATGDDGAETWTMVEDGTDAGREAGWHPGHVEWFPGAAGGVEALVVGTHDWRSAKQVVIALHGGPVGMWKLRFDQMFEFFAAAGMTVIAPNQRGSTGYGSDFEAAIDGAWGGPDLDDVLAIGRHVAAAGNELMLYGASYGAFLALLAAAFEPDYWSRVAVIAPFTSTESLYRAASADVRQMMDARRGRTTFRDARGARDVLDVADRISAKLLILHGERDDVVPCGESRLLRERLLRLGHCEYDTFVHSEFPGVGHGVADGSEERHALITRFLANGTW
jgi:pimeloyl-ACP methyl ester carboxylesterase